MTRMQDHAGQLLRTAPRAAAIAFGLMVLLALTEGAGILLLLPLLQAAGLAGDAPVATSATGWMATVIPRALGPLLVTYVCIVAARAALEIAETRASARAEADVAQRLRERLYGALARARWDAVVPLRGAVLGQTLTSELDRVSLATSQFLRALLDTLLAVTYALGALLVSPVLALVAATGGLCCALLAWSRHARSQAEGAALSAQDIELFASATEQLATLKLARSAGTASVVARRFAERSRAYADAVVAGATRHRRGVALFTVSAAAVLAVVVWIAVTRVRAEPATLLMILFLSARLVPRLASAQGAFLLAVRALPALRSTEALIAHLEAARDAGSEAGEATPLVDWPHGAIALEGVSYRYPGQTHQALDDVTLVLQPGTVTALVGPSGAGKSTLADLLLLLLKPSRGRLTLGGVPVHGPVRGAWRAGVGYVPQETHLFHDTVRENVRCTSPAASDDDIVRALALAGAAPMLARLPNGLDTVIGDRGSLLSGGERQRLSLARALLRQPRLLVLDEATNALDAESEAAVRESLRQLGSRTTVLMITHRLASARHADQIVVIDAGRVQAVGTWDELMQLPASRLAALWMAQDDATSSAETPYAAQIP